MPFSLRLDPAIEGRIRRLALATSRSKSEIVREAIAQYEVDRLPAAHAGGSTLDRLRPYAGIVRTGGAQLSANTHAKYRALVARKHRGRRPR